MANASTVSDFRQAVVLLFKECRPVCAISERERARVYRDKKLSLEIKHCSIRLKYYFILYL